MIQRTVTRPWRARLVAAGTRLVKQRDLSNAHQHFHVSLNLRAHSRKADQMISLLTFNMLPIIGFYDSCSKRRGRNLRPSGGGLFNNSGIGLKGGFNEAP